MHHRILHATLLLTASTLAQAPQPPVDLLHTVAHHYATATFHVKGAASTLLPSTYWKVEYTFDTQNIQPRLLPPEWNATKSADLTSLGPRARTRVEQDATDPYPEKLPINQPRFGDYQSLTDHLLEATKITETEIIVQGKQHTCEIIEAAYDTSPDFLPHTVVDKRRFWIDPLEQTVLREQRTVDGIAWTADVTSYSFDQPPSPQTLASLESMHVQPTERLYWIGRPLPDLTLQQLAGPPIRLVALRGQPVLLDFWGSYCFPCTAATLHAQALARQYRAAGLAVITITQDDAATATLWATHNHLELPVVLDPDRTAFKAFFASEIPIAILADANGQVLHYWTSYASPAAIDEALKLALGDKAPQAQSLINR